MSETPPTDNRRQTVHIGFSGGIEEKVDPAWQDPNVQQFAITNGSFVKAGSISKRMGLACLGNSPTPGTRSSPSTGQKVVSWSRSDLTVMGSNTLYSTCNSPANTTLTSVSPLPPCLPKRTAIPIATSCGTPVICDAFDATGTIPIRLIAWQDDTGIVFVTVLDADGDVVLGSTQVYPINNYPVTVPYKPFIVNALWLPNGNPGQQVYVFVQTGQDASPTVGQSLLAFPYNPQTNSFGAPLVIEDNVASLMCDVAPYQGDPQGGFLVIYVKSSTELVMEYWVGSTFTTSITIPPTGSYAFPTGLPATNAGPYISGVYGERIWVSYFMTLSGTTYFTTWELSGDYVFSLTESYVAPQTTGYPPQNAIYTGQCRLNVNDVLVTWQARMTPPGSGGVYSYTGGWYVWTSGTATPTSVGVTPWGFLAQNAPFCVNGVGYQPSVFNDKLLFGNVGQASAFSTEQSTMYLMQVTGITNANGVFVGLPVATVAKNIVQTANWLSIYANTNGHLSITSATSPTSTDFAVGVNTVGIDSGSVNGTTGPSFAVDFNFPTMGPRLDAQDLGAELHISGGVPFVFDSQIANEDNFFYFPEWTYASLGYSGSPLGGAVWTGSYAVCYAFTDAAGLVHRSAPAYTAEITTSPPTPAVMQGTTVLSESMFGPSGTINSGATITGTQNILSSSIYGTLGTLNTPVLISNVDIATVSFSTGADTFGLTVNGTYTNWTLASKSVTDSTTFLAAINSVWSTSLVATYTTGGIFGSGHYLVIISMGQASTLSMLQTGDLMNYYLYAGAFFGGIAYALATGIGPSLRSLTTSAYGDGNVQSILNENTSAASVSALLTTIGNAIGSNATASTNSAGELNLATKLTGTAASLATVNSWGFVVGSNGTCNAGGEFTDLSGQFLPEMVGSIIFVAGASDPANNLTSVIAQVNSPTSIILQNAAGFSTETAAQDLWVIPVASCMQGGAVLGIPAVSETGSTSTITITDDAGITTQVVFDVTGGPSASSLKSFLAYFATLGPNIQLTASQNSEGNLLLTDDTNGTGSSILVNGAATTTSLSQNFPLAGGILHVISTAATSTTPAFLNSGSGTVYVAIVGGGYATVAYTGITTTSFTGCTGGSGTTVNGGVVSQENPATLAYAAIGLPGTPNPAVGTSGMGGAYLTITNITASYRYNYSAASQIVAEIYRTTNDGSIFFLVDTIRMVSDTPATPAPTTVQWPSGGVADTTPDTSIDASTLLYTTGGVIPNVNPPAALISIVHNGRPIILAEDARTLWMGQAFNSGTAPGWSGSLTIPFAEGGDVTALASMDGKLFVFKQTELWAMFGLDGPALTGQGSDWTVPQKVSSNVGAVSQAAVVNTDVGVFFQSPSGIYLLGRDLSVSFIGKNVIDTLAANPIITSATLVPSATQVRFTCCADVSNGTQGVTICYDYLLQAWTTHVYSWVGSFPDAHFAPCPIASACIDDANQQYTLLDVNGNLYQEWSTTATQPWMDMDINQDVHFVPTVTTLAFLKTEEQGYLRATYAQLLTSMPSSPNNAGLKVQLAINYDPTIVQTATYPAAQLQGSGRCQMVIGAKWNQAMSYQFTVSDVDSGVVGQTGQGARFIALAVELDKIGDRNPFFSSGQRA